MDNIAKRFKSAGFWKQVGFVIYCLVGLVSLIALIWAIIKIANNTLYQTLGFFRIIGFFILLFGGLNLGIKFIFGKDIFGN